LLSQVNSKCCFEARLLLSLSVGDTCCLALFCADSMFTAKVLKKPEDASLKHNLQGITHDSKNKRKMVQQRNRLEQMGYSTRLSMHESVVGTDCSTQKSLLVARRDGCIACRAQGMIQQFALYIRSKQVRNQQQLTCNGFGLSQQTRASGSASWLTAKQWATVETG